MATQQIGNRMDEIRNELGEIERIYAKLAPHWLKLADVRLDELTEELMEIQDRVEQNLKIIHYIRS